MPDSGAHDRLRRLKAVTKKSTMVTFLCQADWAKGCPGSWLNVISVYVVKVLPEEINI